MWSNLDSHLYRAAVRSVFLVGGKWIIETILRSRIYGANLHFEVGLLRSELRPSNGRSTNSPR